MPDYNSKLQYKYYLVKKIIIFLSSPLYPSYIFPGPPSPPENVSVTLVTAVSVTLRWHSVLVAGEPSQNVSVLYTQLPGGAEQEAGSVEVWESGVTVLRLSDFVQPNTSYALRLRIYNEDGQILTDHINVTTPGRPVPVLDTVTHL